MSSRLVMERGWQSQRASTAAPWQEVGDAARRSFHESLIEYFCGLFADTWPARRLDDLAVSCETASQRLVGGCAIRDSNPEPAD